MTKRQFCERAYFRACSLPTSGFLSSDFASKTIRGNPLASKRRRSTKPMVVVSKSSPNASRSDDVMVAVSSRRMLAGSPPSGKKRQPAASSSLLILILEVASLAGMALTIHRPADGRHGSGLRHGPPGAHGVSATSIRVIAPQNMYNQITADYA